MPFNGYRRPGSDFAAFTGFDSAPRPGQHAPQYPLRYPHDKMFDADARGVIDAEFEIIGSEPSRPSVGNRLQRSWQWIRSGLRRI